MIRLYEENETIFNHNKNVLQPTKCFVIEESNGMFELELEVTKQTNIIKGQIVSAPTPRGNQPFRIYRIVKTLKSKKIYGKHIFYDLADNFLIDIRPTNVSCFTALNNVLENTEYDTNFTGTSDITTQNTAYYIRKNPIQAIMSEDNSILNRWGGNLIRDKYNIEIKAAGLDRGYEIRVGKNLVGIEDDSDTTKIKTRLYPTVVLGDNDDVIPLPEKYVNSPLINGYLHPIISEVRVELTDEEKLLTKNQIYTIMRNYCNEMYSVYNVDKPIANYKIDFVELSKTEQYKEFAILEQLDLYDIVTCNVKELDIDIKAKMVKYKYDCLKQRYDNMELGDFRQSSDYSTAGIVKRLQERISATETAVEYATNIITGNKGGNLVIRRNADGTPYEVLFMDTDDINTAEDVLRINKSGIGFSRQGYNGPYETAMTIDSHIVADFIDVGTLTSIIIQSVNYKLNTSGMKINLLDGSLDSKNVKWDSLGNVDITGKITSTSGNIAGWKIESGALTKTFSKTFGPFTNADTTRVQQIILGTITPTAADILNYDITADGKITSLDLAYIQRIVLGVSTGEFDYEISLNTTDPSMCIKTTVFEDGVARFTSTVGTGGMSTPTVTANYVYSSNLIMNGPVQVDGEYGTNGSFTTADGKTANVKRGIITSLY